MGTLVYLKPCADCKCAPDDECMCSCHLAAFKDTADLAVGPRLWQPATFFLGMLAGVAVCMLLIVPMGMKLVEQNDLIYAQDRLIQMMRESLNGREDAAVRGERLLNAQIQQRKLGCILEEAQ